MEVKIVKGPAPDAYEVRDTVFTKEQGFSDPDTDAYDPISTHVIFYENGRAVATGRYYLEENGTLAHIGRVCVAKELRGKDLGRKILEVLLKQAASEGATHARLGAQLYAVPFYERCGFQPTGDRYLDEFCEHEWMTRRL